MALYNHELNAKIKIFSQLYVGLQDQGKEKPKLGFATPLEKGAAFEKRKNTVDNWARVTRYDYEKKQYLPATLETTTVENTLREGFTITDDIKRVYWGGGNVVWRVLDPYGYELEIPSANLMAIIQVSGIGEGGKIPGKCCWGRDGASNILLHEKSDVYVNAIKNAEDIKKAKELHAKDREVGAKYLMQSGDEGTYLGKFYVHSLKTVKFKPGDSYRDREYDHYEVSVTAPSGRSSVGKMYTYEISDDGLFDAVLVYDDRVHFYRKAPFISRADGVALTSRKIKKIMDTGNYTFAASGKHNPIIHVSSTKPAKLVFVERPMSDKTFNEVLAKAKDSVKNAHWGFSHLFHCYKSLPRGFTMGADEGVLWQNGGSRQADYPGKMEEFFCGTHWDEQQLRVVHCDYGRSYYSGPYVQGTTFKTTTVPNKAMIVEWLKELRENAYLKEITVAEKD